MKSGYWAIRLVKNLYIVLAVIVFLSGVLALGLAASNNRFGEGLLPLVAASIGAVTMLAISQGIQMALDAVTEIKTQTAIQKQLLAYVKKRTNGR